MNNIELEKEIKQLVHNNRDKKGYVCSVDILMQLDYLSKKDYENWRFGRVNYLEKVCQVSLKKLTLINKLIKKYSKELNLKGSWMYYRQFERGVKRQLQFSKSGQKSIEEAYSTHYVDTIRIEELKAK